MHPTFTWFVRLILLFVLSVGLVLLYFALKEALDNVKGRKS